MMSREKIYQVSGYVRDNESHGLPGLRVEIWDKDILFDDPLGAAVTDSNGYFSITLYEERDKRKLIDRRPDIFFKVRKGKLVTDKLIRDTSNDVLKNVEPGTIELKKPIIVDFTDEQDTNSKNKNI